MRLDPDDHQPDLVSAYQRLHTELRDLATYAPTDTDESNEAAAFRQLIADRQQILGNLTHLLLGDGERRIGQNVVPLGCVSVYLN